uniref:Carboxylic ester hydrolase n=1 Tax=Anoplophora glabripennis TaxID=217634 RepID=V5G2A7_ANOGL
MTEPLVTVKQGQLRGKKEQDYHGGTFYRFSGIPYAKAPVGELRFKAPQPAESWEGVKDATKEGAECPSLNLYFGYYVGNEDNCLNLNVYIKSLPKENNEKKPVMVWVHGGGFLYGSNKSEYFGPDYLLTEDIILVSINYRLGIFGFLSLEDESLGVPGNTGLKDQVLALKWIQQNIHSFGGDPHNVTIFGESAGAASVHYLTLSPLTKGLFNKAIVQSGSSLNPWALGKRNAEDAAKCMGYKDKDEKAVLERLQKDSQRNIVTGVFKIVDDFKARTIRPFSPVIETPSEDAFLTEHPLEILKSGRNHQIPMIIGYNTAEGMLIELIRRTKSYGELPKNLEGEVPWDLKVPPTSGKTKEIAEKIRKYYYDGEDVTDENVLKTYKLVGDIQFLYGIQKAIRLQKRNGSQPIYVYRNSLDGTLNFFKKFCTAKYFKTMVLINFLGKLSGNSSLKTVFQKMSAKLPYNESEGVAHADDLFYLFPTFFTPKIVTGSKEDCDIYELVNVTIFFAKSGNPTPELDEKLNNVVWKPIESEHIDNVLGLDNELKLIKNLEGERLKFWEEIYEEYS